MRHAHAFVMLLFACHRITHAAPPPLEAMIHDNALPEVRYSHTPIVEADFRFYGPDWAWAGSTLGRDESIESARVFKGTIPKWDVQLHATVGQADGNRTRIDFELIAERPLDNLMGGGIEFRLGVETSDTLPELRPDERGWRWEIAPGRFVEVVFDRPLAGLYFERGDRGVIRAFFIGKTLRAGRHHVSMELLLPAGATWIPSATERYGPEDLGDWHAGVIWDTGWMIDASSLNEGDRPAGSRGPIRVEMDRFVYPDGSQARFWGTNVAAHALFQNRETIRIHARRLAAHGYNLVRLHHHDSDWVRPNVLHPRPGSTTVLNADVLDSIDWWVHCLREEGIYVWLDLHVGRHFTEAQVPDGFKEYSRLVRGERFHARGFAYFNPAMRRQMKAFNEAYLTHFNPYTKLAYKDDPAILGLLITNENDLTFHFGNMIADSNKNPWHYAQLEQDLDEFVKKTGLSRSQTLRTWEPGPGTLFLADREHAFNVEMLAHLRGLGVKAPVATTNFWAKLSGYSLPSLADGDLIDAHSYGQPESLGFNPRTRANFISRIAAAQLADRPLTISEWNVPYPATDRFTAPLYMAAIASLQGWDAPMVYAYAQNPFSSQRPSKWETYADPAITGLMPAAAIAFRRGDIRVAEKTFTLRPSAKDLFDRRIDADASATIRTLAERSRLTFALDDSPHLDWDSPTTIPAGSQVLADPDIDFLPQDQTHVESDTGEIRRDWARGLLTIHTERTIAASGWMEGASIEVGPATFEIGNPKATAVLTSLDGLAIPQSKNILLTVIARATLDGNSSGSFLSEPIRGRVTLRSELDALAIAPINRRGEQLPAIPLERHGDAYTIILPVPHGTHWFVLTLAPR